MPESVDPRHLLLIGAGPGVVAGVVRRFGHEGFRSTLIARGEALEQLAEELRSDGLEIETVRADIDDLDDYRATLERIFRAPGAPGVAVYNAALPDPGEILDTTIPGLRTAYNVDVLGAVVAAQVAVPVPRSAGAGTLLFTSAASPTTLGRAWDGVRSRQDRGAVLDRPHRPDRRLADRVSIHRHVAGSAASWRRFSDGGCLSGRGRTLASFPAEEVEQRRVDLLRVRPADVVRAIGDLDTVRSAISPSSRKRPVVAATGSVRSAAPWTARTGMSILDRSPRKSVSQVSMQA